MERSEIGLWVKQNLGAILVAYGKENEDSGDGFQFQLSQAYVAYFNLNEIDYDPDAIEYDIPYEDFYCFSQYLTGLIYGMVLPAAALVGDFAVDAPLTNVKQSQVYRQLKDMRDNAFGEAANCGYPVPSVTDYVGGFKVNLDFVEPGCTTASEFG